MTTMRKLVITFGILAFVGLLAVGAAWWWTNPLLISGRHRVDVYALDEGVSGKADRRPGFISRLIGMCDADSYYVVKDAQPYCLVLSGQSSSGPSRPLTRIDVTKDGDQLVIHAAEVATLRDIATRIPELTAGDSQTLILTARGKPVAEVPVEALNESQTIRVEIFGR
jgi:hypothetical protein